MINAIGFHAVLDLLKRYAVVFDHAWRNRKSFDATLRLSHEAQFLPAALELQETPVSPAPRVTMWLIMCFGLIAVLWATFGHIDVVAIATGKIVPSGRTKIIQSVETATIKFINVTDGQAVKAGDVLIKLDATSATADSARFGNDLVTARLQAARAKAMLVSISAGRSPVLERMSGLGADRFAQEQRILDGQYGEYLAKLARADADILKRKAELATTHEAVKKIELTMPIVRQRAQDFKDLVEKNFISRHGYLEKEQARIEQEADLTLQRSRLRELEAALQEASSQRATLVAETRRDRQQ